MAAPLRTGWNSSRRSVLSAARISLQSESDLVSTVHLAHKNSRGSVISPVTADAATVYGEARYTCAVFDPILPGKLRLVVEMHTSLLFRRPKVSDGPPKHAAQDAPCESFVPAF